MTILTNEEKLAVVNQHIKSIEYAAYGLGLDLIEAQSVTNPDSEQIAAINTKIADIDLKKAALIAEKNSLTTQE